MHLYETFPSRTLNGSSMRTVAEDCSKALHALEEARRKVIDAAPHPRDYIGRDDLYQTARTEHHANTKALSDMIDFYEAKAIHCFDQIKEGSSW